MQHLAIRMARGMVVPDDRMAKNLDLTCGALFSKRALLAIIDTGLQRDEAYRIVQETAQQAWDSGTPLRDLLAERDLDLDLVDQRVERALTRHPHRHETQPGEPSATEQDAFG